jgi:uncharacterized protein YjiS (DUF1127 family)
MNASYHCQTADTASPLPASAGWTASLGQLAAGAVELLLLWAERARSRRLLGQLNNHALKDIGVTRADVDAELRKPFWQP